MDAVERTRLVEAIAVTAELTRAELSKPALQAMLEDLACYPLGDVLRALHRCRRELRRPLTPADVIERIPGLHPRAEEAWAIVPKDEATTAVITQPMIDALVIALPLVEQRDRVGASMAFRAAYDRLVGVAPPGTPQWRVSLGTDRAGRVQPIADAVLAGRLPREHACALIGDQAPELLDALTSSPAPVAAVTSTEELARKRPKGVKPAPITALGVQITNPNSLGRQQALPVPPGKSPQQKNSAKAQERAT